jgi:hypothetical protein
MLIHVGLGQGWDGEQNQGQERDSARQRNLPTGLEAFWRASVHLFRKFAA